MCRIGLGLSLLSLATLAGCQTLGTNACGKRAPDPAAGAALAAVYELPVVCNGITVQPGGTRAFVSFPKVDGGGGATLAEIKPDSGYAPYPDVAANTWKPGEDAAKKLVRVNSLRFGPDGYLWVVDVGSPAQDEPVLPGGPKLVAIDVTRNAIVRTLPLDAVVKPKSFVDDFRFGDKNVYVTDAGVPALIVVDAKTGQGRRVLEGHPSTVARDMYAEGRLLKKPSGEHVRTHADQLEISPDGTLLYYCPCSGPTSKIETKYLDDASLTDAQLAAHVTPFYDNATIGGTAIDDRGRVYFDDVDHQRIVRVTPDGKAETILQDKARLHWGDAMWIDDAHHLWVPCPQMNRGQGMNDTVTKTQWPVTVYKTTIDAGPVRR